jgi:Tfp pilus assembly protein PilO
MSKASQQASNTAFRSRVITLLAGAGAIAYAFFVFVPGQKSLTRLNQQVLQKQQNVAQTNLLVQPITQTQQELNTTDAFIAQWRERSPRGSQLSQTVGRILQAAERNEVEIVQLQPQEETALQTITTTPVNLRVAGSYQHVYGMLRDLDKMGGVLWVEQLDLQAEPANNDELECTIKLVIFSDRGEISG